jgi:mono/diheme cytochrome c family protein
MKLPLALSLACLAGLFALVETGLEAAEPADYVRDVKPLLAKHCVTCHGATKPRAGLRLDTAAAALRGNKDGPAVVPGSSDESPLILAVLGEGSGERMPLKRPPLSDPQVAILRSWIDQGARAPADETPDPASATHWAFVPPRRPELPACGEPAWSDNPIDRFIRDRLRQAGLSPAPEADRATLVRRLSLDLIGLPPTPGEVLDFVADTRPDAYERLVDRLLASPHFGERWARPWLDLARYADSNGYSIDAPRSIWNYRDWVIDALNRDMPFDRFTIDQLAGDLRPGATLAQQVATGFHRNTPINQEGGIDVEQFRVESIVDRVNTTATVWLGLTLGCAQCHDHKYDPIAQREYYELFAFFNNADEPTIELAEPEVLARRDQIRKEIDAFHKRLEAEHPEVQEKEQAWEKTLLGDFKTDQVPEIKDAFDRSPEKRTEAQRRGLIELFLAQDDGSKPLYDALAPLLAALPEIGTTMVVREHTPPRETCVMLGGDFTRKGDRVAPDVPAVLPPLARSEDHPPDRMDLARWLVDGRNPLSPRVTVNRLWQAYFGRGLVETENDFGLQGTPPTHPELLDWLATELVAQGWSLKAMHRLIVTSMTYRQSSRARPELEEVDPDNRLLARQSRLRLDAEVIRDAALAASGLLSPRIGGPSVFPPQPDGVMNLGQMKRKWEADTGPDRYRRGLYTFFWRATPHPSLIVFDAPNSTQACTRRVRSNTPLQALTLLNDRASIEFAEALAARLLDEAPPDDAGRIGLAFRLCLAREPSPKEARTVRALLAQERAEAGADGSDSHGGQESPAAWTTLARVLLNLDEFITRE